jgi:hypothetical protein
VDKPASWFIEAAKPLKKKSLRESWVQEIADSDNE